MNDSINYLEIGARIRRQREQIGLTQEQLGEACDLSTSFVGHIERGSRKLSCRKPVQNRIRTGHQRRLPAL